MIMFKKHSEELHPALCAVTNGGFVMRGSRHKQLNSYRVLWVFDILITDTENGSIQTAAG